jgi:aldehyde dehydrogenase (NAD+)
MEQRFLNFVNGRAIAAMGDQWLPVVDPSLGESFAQIPNSQADDIDNAVNAASRAFELTWRTTSAAQRGQLLMELSRAITKNAEELAQFEAQDTGKPLNQAKADVAALSRYFEFYAGAADKLHGQTIPYTDGFTVLTVREPLGVTGHIIPWNYPMQIFGRSVGASLAAGNCCVVKPAEDACISLLRIAQIAFDVGFPAGVLNVVAGLGSSAGAALAAHHDIAHISFTGSTATGTTVARLAATHHTPVTLELGGKSPQLIFDDADLDAALPSVVNAIIQNAGQTCSAGSRVYIQRSIYDNFMEQLSARFCQLKAGPSAMNLDLGPLINKSQQQRVWDFLSDAQASGIAFAAEGSVHEAAPEKGFYQAPVLLSHVPQDSRLMRQEIFGPVLCAAAFDTEQQALAMANDSDFGLVAGIWTRDGSRQMRLARRLQSGQVFINNYGAGGGVELPFGGVKQSGHGREKGFEALYGFTSLKTIALRHG